MSIQDKIINGVKADAERNALGDFPLHIFPEKATGASLRLYT
jgi:hypothetical protein